MTDTPHPIDVAVGSRVRLRREELDFTQLQLARGIGVTFQQVQKYERGANRISASRLMQIAEFLHTSGAALLGENAGQVDANAPALLNTPGAIDLLKAYQGIAAPEHRRGLLAMARSLDAGKSR